jgi:hypothetical protein
MRITHFHCIRIGGLQPRTLIFLLLSLTTNLIKKLGECPRIAAVVFYLYKSIQLVQYNAFYLYKYIQLVCCHGSQLLAIILHSLGKKCSLLSVLIVQNYHLGIWFLLCFFSSTNSIWKKEKKQTFQKYFSTPPLLFPSRHLMVTI